MEVSSSFLDEKLLQLCAEGTFEALKAYLKAGIRGRINQPEETSGNTALHLAASSEEKDTIDKVKLLVQAGANPSALNFKGETPAISSSFKNRRRLPLRSRHDSSSSDSEHLLLIACKSECSEVVQVLLDEIIAARRGAVSKYLMELQGGSEQAISMPSPSAASTVTQGSDTLGIGNIAGFDIKEFLDIPEPRQIVFFELGADLAASNAVEPEDLENSIYGRMLLKTPGALEHLLDSCVYYLEAPSDDECKGKIVKAKTTKKKNQRKTVYIDLFPFYNPLGSELNLLKAVIHFKRFELLTHPVCELFLYLKWRRARWIYYIVLALDVIYCLLVLTYAMLYYGELGDFLSQKEGSNCAGPPIASNGTATKPPIEVEEELNCKSKWIRYPVLVSALLMTIIQLAKLIQDRKAVFSLHFWKHRIDELYHVLVIVLFIVDQFPVEMIHLGVHKMIAAFLVLSSCRIMVHTIARDPDTAMVVEMVTSIQNGLFKFFVCHIWLFLGWIVAFHITLGEKSINDNGYPNSFHDIGSATAKVLAMFTGELGFETAFSAATSLSTDTAYSFFVIVLFTGFTIEMCVILMNLLIGLAINDIQDLRVNADTLRLMKEVVLQRYLESLLTYVSMPSLIRRLFSSNKESSSSSS